MSKMAENKDWKELRANWLCCMSHGDANRIESAAQEIKEKINDLFESAEDKFDKDALAIYLEEALYLKQYRIEKK